MYGIKGSSIQSNGDISKLGIKSSSIQSMEIYQSIMEPKGQITRVRGQKVERPLTM